MSLEAQHEKTVQAKEVHLQSVAGISGRCRMVKHDVAGLRGSGPNGEVDFHDLWEEGPDGQWVSKHPERITEDRTHKNKMLCRGLSYLMYTAVQYQTGTVASKQPTDITHYPDRNPFLAFILIGDDSATPVRPGDAKVVWHESDGEFDDKIPAGSGRNRNRVLLKQPVKLTAGLGKFEARVLDATDATVLDATVSCTRLIR